MKKVELVDGFYKLSLLGLIVVLILINFYTLLVNFNYLTLIPLTLQLAILITVFQKSEFQEVMIKIWAFIIFIGGLAGLIAVSATWASKSLGGENFNLERLSLPYILYAIIRFAAGIYFFTKYKNNVKKI